MPSARATASAAPRRPIGGTSVSVPVLDFSPPAGRCPAAYPVLLSIDFTAELSHLGRTHVVQSNCIATPGPGSAPENVAGVATFTAANGDAVFATYDGTVVPIVPPAGPPTEGAIYAAFVFDGGTGRFAGATGEMAATGVVVFDGPATVKYVGWIAY